MSNNLANLFGHKELLPKLPRQILYMYAHHGKKAEKKCKDCAHLTSHSARVTWYKCLKYGASMSSATDWRLKWDACGLWIEKEGVEQSV